MGLVKIAARGDFLAAAIARRQGIRSLGHDNGAMYATYAEGINKTPMNLMPSAAEERMLSKVDYDRNPGTTDVFRIGKSKTTVKDSNLIKGKVNAILKGKRQSSMSQIEAADNAKEKIKNKIIKREANVKDRFFSNVKSPSKASNGGGKVTKVVEEAVEIPVNSAVKTKATSSAFLKQHGGKIGIGALAAGAGLAGYLTLKKNKEKQ